MSHTHLRLINQGLYTCESVILLRHSSPRLHQRGSFLLEAVGTIVRTYCKRRTHMLKSIRRSNEACPFGLTLCICRVTQRTFTSPQNNSVSFRSPLSCSAVGVSFRAKSPPALYFVDSCRMLPQASAINVRSWLEFGFPNRMRRQVEPGRFLLRDVKCIRSHSSLTSTYIHTWNRNYYEKMINSSASKTNCRNFFF